MTVIECDCGVKFLKKLIEFRIGSNSIKRVNFPNKRDSRDTGVAKRINGPFSRETDNAILRH